MKQECLFSYIFFFFIDEPDSARITSLTMDEIIERLDSISNTIHRRS